MNKTLYVTLTGLFCLVTVVLKAQTTLNVSGATVSNNSNSITTSIGQVFVQMDENDDYSISEGVLQPYEVFEIEIPTSNLDWVNELEMNVFPNPVTHYLTLKTTSPKLLSASLHTAQGQELTKLDQFNYESKLQLENYPTGVYIVQVYHDNTVVKTFKIIKK
ncbi:T9SS type A sorting domain-containing protein [Flammeovirga aprica]|uniref:T9SS type A sorting domain-containing protein n=1 Tax=Flammeovirga aprica JL-4 TaxID=694437 RepID=A0A7X9P3V0_9BACT|nr:T9SS type A sorting domain-containing protein [Flammeovirga aprica]NME68097.1 T9SS type A sorting domain-containing protein [Flammeovirga aprica JL-4]